MEFLKRKSKEELLYNAEQAVKKIVKGKKKLKERI